MTFVVYLFQFILLINGLESVGDATTTANAATGVVIEEVLEEAPKWKVLRVSD